MALDFPFSERLFAVFAFDWIEGLVSIKKLLGFGQGTWMHGILVPHQVPQVLANEAATMLITWVLIPDDGLLGFTELGTRLNVLLLLFYVI